MKTLKKTTANKNDYEVYEYNSGYFGICLKPGNEHADKPVFGGDSANVDDYNRELMESVYDSWDGTLNSDGQIEL